MGGGGISIYKVDDRVAIEREKEGRKQEGFA
jgi:hypothetical protein